MRILLVVPALCLNMLLFAQTNPVDSLQAAYNRSHNAESLLYLAKAYTFRDVNKAAETYQLLIRSAARQKDTLQLATAYILAGRFYFYTRLQRVTAKDYYTQALLLLQNNGSEQGRAVRLWGQGILNSDKSPLAYGSSPAVTVYDSTVLPVFFESARLQKSKFLLAETWLDIQGYYGWFYDRIPLSVRTQAAGYTFGKCIQLFSEANCSDGVTEAMFKAATAWYYECRGASPADPQHCRIYESLFGQAYDRAVRSSNTLVQARILNHYAYNQITKRNYDSAVSLIQQAEKLAAAMHDADQLLRYLMTYMDLYAARKDYPKAAFYTHRYNALRDSLLNINNAEQLAYVQNNYENQKRDLQIKRISEESIRKQNAFNQYLLVASSVIIALAAAIGFLVVYIRQRSKNARLNELIRQNLEDQLLQVQLQALQAQMNPHFIFNALTSIQNLILSEDKTKAVQYLNEFAQLSRTMLDNSRREQIKLQDEISFLQRYLKLEQLRHNHCFEYSIEVDDNIDPGFEKVPPMLIQPFVENAIKHGLSPAKNGGKLSVKIFYSDDEQLLICVVDDNGIGRKASAKLGRADHNSVATAASGERMMLMSHETKAQYKYDIDITDKYSGTGDALGTTVTLTIPLYQQKEMT